jgi:hypothetical protein
MALNEGKGAEAVILQLERTVSSHRTNLHMAPMITTAVHRNT